MARLNGNKAPFFSKLFNLDFVEKFKELFWDATVGILKQYQEKSLDIVKLEAAGFYVRAIQLLRRQTLTLALVIFLIVIAAVAIVVAPLVLVSLAPWTRGVKIVLGLVLGIIDVGVPILLVQNLFSEKRWMETTKTDEILERVMKNS